MKKLINSPGKRVVTDALAGHGLRPIPRCRSDTSRTRSSPRAGARRPREKVGLVSGGGLGSRAAGTPGFRTATEMLDAACAGEVFTSPVPDQIVIATTAVNGRRRRSLHVVKKLHRRTCSTSRWPPSLRPDEGIEVALGGW